MVHLLVIVQNNKRCTVQGIKIMLVPMLVRIIIQTTTTWIITQ